jgi:hypothetical protein
MRRGIKIKERRYFRSYRGGVKYCRNTGYVDIPLVWGARPRMIITIHRDDALRLAEDLNKEVKP